VRRKVFQSEHEQFRATVREFIAREVAPNTDAWEAGGIVDRQVYRAAGKHGVIGFNVPEEFGGGGVDDFRFNAVVCEELAKAGSGTPSFTLHNDIVAPYQTIYGGTTEIMKEIIGKSLGV
jgi:alkylation response protein AidB-like acyl-CoA dehydrogenase